MKKFLSIILVITMLLCVLVSCKKDSSENADSQKSGNEVNTDGDSETDRLDELGERDFGGKIFNVLDANDYPDMHVNYATEESRGISNITEALYNRDVELKEMYNLEDIKYTTITKATAGIDALRNQIQADALEYDMVISTAVGSTITDSTGGTLAALAIQNMLRNLNEVNYLSLDKEWWSPLIYKNLSINNKLFFTTGDISPSLYQAPTAMYANMDLLAQYYKDVDIFKIVDDGEWTFAKVNELTKDLSRDEDENNIMSATDDFFGIAIQKSGNTVQELVVSSGSNFSKVTNNTLSVDLKNNEALSSAIDSIKRLYPTMEYNYGANGDQQNVINITFKTGKAVFLAHKLESAMFHLRDMEGDYAVLPFPKANADQPQYLSAVSQWVDCFIAVPSAVPNDRIEFVGFMMEAMAAYSNKTLRPFIYESVLKYQRMNDAKSSAMVDVIMDGIVIDFAVIYDIGNLGNIIENVAFHGKSLNTMAIGASGSIKNATKLIMKAHGIEQ